MVHFGAMNKENTSKPEEPTPFEKFRSLAKKLVNVPRKEYEREQEKYEATKDKNTRRGKVKAVS
jgi:hypothetical protein